MPRSNFHAILTDRALTQPVRRCLYGNDLTDAPFWNGAIFELPVSHYVWQPLCSSLHLSLMLLCMPEVKKQVETR